MIWQQTLQKLASYIRQLERDLADVDRLVSAHQHLIDFNTPDKWPKDSILGRAVSRHTARELEKQKMLSELTPPSEPVP